LKVDGLVKDSMISVADYGSDIDYLTIEQRRIEQMFMQEVEEIFAMVTPKVAKWTEDLAEEVKV
jgi:hypothetical protein